MHKHSNYMHVRFLFFNMAKIKVCHERINATIQSIVDPQNAVKQDFASRPRRFFSLPFDGHC